MNNTIAKLHLIIPPDLLNEGKNTTSIPYIDIYRYSQVDIVLPDIPNPYLFLVLNGTIRLSSADCINSYEPGQYFFPAIDSPRVGEALSASREMPFVALLIELSVDDVISVMLDIDSDLPEKLFDEKVTKIMLPYIDEKLLEIVSRLFTMTQTELSFMGKHLKREIIFNLITGSCGRQFVQNIVNIQQAGDIYYINSWIKQNYKADFSVEELAEQSNMSLSSFHQKFKSAIGMGPVQCQKKLRLTEARRLMLDKAANVTDAAMEVGYDSVSQFIRDYRRMFGRSPQKDVQEIRECIQKQTNP